MPTNGTPRKRGPKPSPPSARMHRFVIKSDDGCWDWNGGTANGYGVIGDGVRVRRSVYAHRVAWTMASGEPIPDGHFVLHTCDNRRCTKNDEPGVYEVDGVAYPRWGHLFCAPQLANVRDMYAKGRDGYPGMPGASHPLTHLTDTDVVLIRQRAASGEIRATLAREYGVKRETIYAIVGRRTWKHLP